jgi:hypothetical protein
MSINLPEFPMPQGPVGTGVGTTNARFLKFSEPVREFDPVPNFRDGSTPSGGSQSGGSTDGPRDGMVMPHYQSATPGPLDDFAYARARKPTIKTEDVSGIEKSGLRSMLDKKSGDVRKGLAKTFAFRRKDKEEKQNSGFRPESAATVRQNAYVAEPEYPYDAYTPEQAQPQLYQAPYQSPTAENWDGHSYTPYPPPAGKLPPVPQAPPAPPIKRWIGAGRPVQRWNKLRKDPELWDPNGDVLVFFGHKGQVPRPNPSFRLSSHIIEATESRYLITLLREGSNEEDIHMPPSPSGAPPMIRNHGMGGQYLGHGLGRGGQPTPPISEDASLGEADGQISYEMYFHTPPTMAKVDQLRHHITTRNVFALLYHSSLVGLSLHQALSDLLARLDAYMPPESDNVGMILNYLAARGIDDVRGDAETAVSLLAWSEAAEVRWEEGWRECFLHCVGMYNQLERCADFKSITPITRALLDRACLEMQLRVQAAEERLVEFQYSDMWSPVANGATNPAKAAADRLQKFFLGHYSRVYGYWPPLTPGQQAGSQPGSPGDSEESDSTEWLTRTVAQTLQRDFGALYDYLVNRDVVWDGSEARSARKWMMVSEAGNRMFEADIPDLPMTDMLIEFDNKLRFPHIPHPYPLVPESIPPSAPLSTAKESSSLFKSSSKKNGGSGSGGNGGNGGSNSGRAAGALERRVQLAYTEATNIYVLGSDFTQSDLIDAFVKFEKSDHIAEVDPAIARRGRWVLIYGVLQILASVSVDALNVRYREDVSYHLCPRLKGTRVPPWRGSGDRGYHQSPADTGSVEAAHELSHCWIVPRTWVAGAQNNSGAESSGGSGNTSPVIGLNRNMAYPRPPPTTITTTSRNSAAGYYTPATRSVYSSGSRPPLGSVISGSDSDAGSSVRTPASIRGPTSMTYQTRSRDNPKGLGNGPGSLRSTATFGGTFETVDEHEYPIRRRDFSAHGDTSSNSSAYGGGYGYARSTHSSMGPPHALPMPAGITGSGGIHLPEDMLESRRGSFSTAVSGRTGMGRRPTIGARSETGSIAPVIKDFDAWDVIDDALP